MANAAASEKKLLDDTPRRSGQWSDEEIDQLIDLWGKNLSNFEIGERIGRRENAVAIKASRLKLPPKAVAQVQLALGRTSRRPGAKVRPCLCCQRQFFSEGPGNRICDTCKSSRGWGEGNEYSVRIGGGF
ncbi:GcrA family cell cycle regulator [Cereibacter sphaeroides]|uniref:GcrA family cell cycle regulator n=1 Tax=Cereibacter sphaeroides TaxID=1063 RepID=UPI001F44E7D3|nr:GcrA family cell cycle regulator [Cereibacter sphaeroides]MCE6959654.1 GcrA family cell cycle regulator [Cereibacter sphaeroides]MCE6974485.1 GcrA family cell cycle regulator [Cereibacter sphaeroides]